jgi:hypothetical protein
MVSGGMMGGGMMGGSTGSGGSIGPGSTPPPSLTHVVTNQGGLGDVVLGAGYRVVNDSATGVQLVVGTRIKLPTASADRGLGTGKRDVAFVGTLRRQFSSGWIYGEGGYILLGDPAGVNLRNSFQWAVGGGRRVASRLYALASAYGNTAILPEFGTPAEIGAGIGITVGHNMNLTIVPSVGLSSASPRVALTIGFGREMLRR